MNTIVEDWSIEGADGEAILGACHRPAADDEARGVLLIAHGFKGYKDYGLFPHLAEAAARSGLIAHRFSFSHSGVTRRIETFERPDLFERDTWGKQVFDLHTVARAAKRGEIFGRGFPQVWFGHSFGGVTALIAAGIAEQEQPDIAPAAVISAAAPHTANRVGEDDKGILRGGGRVESPSSRTGQMLWIGREWLDELEADPARFDPLRHAARLRAPLLLVHGDADASVDIRSARLLHKAAGSKARLSIIPEATHTFNAPNPLPLSQTPPPQTTLLLRIVADFALETSLSARRL